MSKILIIRFSAIGDVAMTIPVIYDVAKANISSSFTVLTQSFLVPLFIHRPENVHVIGLDTKGAQHSIWGLLRFSFFLHRKRYDMVLDLHDVIRSWIVDLVFLLKGGTRVFKLDKGRKERKMLIRRSPKEIKLLRPMTMRYSDVFRKAGFEFEPSFASLYENCPANQEIIHSIAGEKKGRWIGIAPFAKHRGKIYPIERMEQVISILSKEQDVSLFLFGGKGEEAALLDQWALRYTSAKNIAGKYPLNYELALISQLDVLICMDSANMHFASLVGTRVISIWGATHPFSGFYGYRQPFDLAVQVDLPCRPCSIFGNKPCYRGDWACMEQIMAEDIITKVHGCLTIKNR